MPYTIEFSFQQLNTWNMGPACGTDTKDSENPAPQTGACIYIIHNENENSTYVGYADNAKDRWSTRYEVFHCFGIPKAYAKKVHCAWCYPTLDGHTNVLLTSLTGQNSCEHLLMRAVVKGLLGPTTCTNTQQSKTAFYSPHVSGVRVYFPVQHNAKWGKLENAKQANLNGMY